ncbi:MAG: hypothetical protein OEZ22_12105 [Spirochaetia bacterium]|nr:hypothetical protein [Spirochaetia bacterium]
MFKLSPLKIILLIGFFFVSVKSSFSETIESFMDIKESEKTVWVGIIPDKQFDFYLIDDFENKIHWFIEERSAHEITDKFIKKIPAPGNSKNPVKRKKSLMHKLDLSYAKRSAKTHSRAEIKEPQYSYEIQGFFQNPGEDMIILNVPESLDFKKNIEAIPRALAVWINSSRKAQHTLYAIFSNYNNKKIPVKIAVLNFKGWERIEIQIPRHIAARNPEKAHKLDFNFLGFKLMSSSNEEPAFYRMIIDQPILLVDRSQDFYPGAEIKDNWK